MTRLNRSKPRTLEMTDPFISDNEKLDNAIVELYKLNLAKNAAEKAYNSSRAELLKTMKDKGIKNKKVETNFGENSVTIEAKVATPTSDKANVQKLFSLVDKKTFLSIVSATKKAIVDAVGEAVFKQVAEEVAGEENVSVGLLKK